MRVAWETLSGARGEHTRTDIHFPVFEGRSSATCVGLDLPLEVMGAAEGFDRVWRQLRGPTEPGEELHVLVPAGERKLLVRGSVRGIPEFLLDAPDREVVLSGTCRDTFYARVREGAPFDAWVSAAGELETLAVPWRLTLSRADRPEVRALATPTIRAGVLDFGELVFPPTRVLARVRVADEAGATVGSARIETRSAFGTSYAWTDDSGSCRIAGPLAELPLELRATRDSFLPSVWVTLVEPDVETTLVLRSGATLEARVIVPERVRFEELEFELRGESGDATDSTPERITDPESGRVRFTGCKPGRATLVVSDSEHDTLLERAGIELLAGQTTTLEPIDLRDFVSPFTLTFELASGGPWRSGHLELREPDGELATWTPIDASGRATFLAPRASVDLWAAGRGARPRLFEGVRDGDRLTLAGAPAVRLRLGEDVRTPAPPLALVLRCERVRPATMEFEICDGVDDEEAVVRADGSVLLEQPWPGEYELSWFVRHTATGVEFPVTQPELQTISITEDTSAPIVEASLTRAELARAVLDAGG